MCVSKKVFLERVPTPSHTDTDEFCAIWDSVVDRIIERMLDIARPQMLEIHINLREEMAYELGRLTLMMTRKVVEDRLARRPLEAITADVEREECLGEEGVRRIHSTAQMACEHVWMKFYRERWQPKTARALQLEVNPPPSRRLKPHPGKRNHFISKSFIRRGWATGDKIQRFARNDDGTFHAEMISFGAWGHRDGLYSPHREAYFGLVEGDAMPCLDRLLTVKPLNRPQKEALVGFFVIQKLRNPYLMESMNQKMRPLVANMVGGGKEDDAAYMRAVYETLYQDNDFYRQVAGPFFKNRWALVRSKKPEFVLPDVSHLSGVADEKSYIVLPLTSRTCLVVLPEEDAAQRIIPHYVEGDAELVAALVDLAILNCRREFAADVLFQLRLQGEAGARERVVRALVSLSARCAEKEKSEESDRIAIRATGRGPAYQPLKEP